VYSSGSATFVHGGNSLQERVIPVLVFHQKAANRLSRDMQYEVTVEPLPPLLSYNRLRLSIQPAPTEQGILPLNLPKTIALALRVPQGSDTTASDPVSVTLHDAPGAKIQNQAVEVPLNANSIEVAFTLHSTNRTFERVRIEIYHPSGTVSIAPVTPSTFFDVMISPTAAKQEQPSDSSGSETNSVVDSPGGFLDWQAAIPDDGTREAFNHIYQYGSITEVELVKMLANPRKVRRFSQNIEIYQSQIPFTIQTESTPSGKRYVKT
jgi:hypothetical protein